MNYERYKSAESRQQKSSFKPVSNRNRKVNQDFCCLQLSFGFLMFEYAGWNSKNANSTFNRKLIWKNINLCQYYHSSPASWQFCACLRKQKFFSKILMWCFCSMHPRNNNLQKTFGSVFIKNKQKAINLWLQTK